MRAAGACGGRPRSGRGRPPAEPTLLASFSEGFQRRELPAMGLEQLLAKGMGRDGRTEEADGWDWGGFCG